MRSLFNFFVRFSNILIYIPLGAVAIYMLTTANGYHNIMLSNQFKAFEAIVEKKIFNASEYLRFRRINAMLVEENLGLRKRLTEIYNNDEHSFIGKYDTIHKQKYVFTGVICINQSTNKKKNYLSLNKGSAQGIESGMAVVCASGIVGTIIGTSKNFSIAMSVLNLDFKLSSRHRKSSYYGSLSWEGTNPRIALLDQIPHHINVQIGDTIESSGFSLVFPTGIMVGTVSSFDDEGGGFYKIYVELATDFSNLNYLYVIGNLQKNEQVELEQKFIE